MTTRDPLPAYQFIVDWGGEQTSFSEISGLNISVDVTEYREGSNPEATVSKIPGLVHYSNIVLKRGMVKGDNDFFNWINMRSQGKIEKRNVSISLLNENREVVVIWRVRNAFPAKYSGPVLQANGIGIAIEELELAHEGLVIENV